MPLHIGVNPLSQPFLLLNRPRQHPQRRISSATSALFVTRLFLHTRLWEDTRPATGRDHPPQSAAKDLPRHQPPPPPPHPPPRSPTTPLVGPTSAPSATSLSPPARPWADTSAATTREAPPPPGPPQPPAPSPPRREWGQLRTPSARPNTARRLISTYRPSPSPCRAISSTPATTRWRALIQRRSLVYS